MKETAHVSPALPAIRREYFGAYGSDKTWLSTAPRCCRRHLPVTEATVPSFHVTRRSPEPPPHLRQAHTARGQRAARYRGHGHPQTSDLPSDDGAAPAAQTSDIPSNFPTVSAGKAALVIAAEGRHPHEITAATPVRPVARPCAHDWSDACEPLTQRRGGRGRLRAGPARPATPA